MRAAALTALGLVVAALTVVGGMVVPVVGGTAGVRAVGVSSALVPVTPCRLADTRPAPDGPYGFSRVAASTIRVSAAGRCGVGPNATAVVLSIAAVGVTAPGFVTVYPTGTGRPLASNLNYRTGEIRANAAVVAVGPGASFDVFTSSGSLVVDVTGWFTAADTSAAGRFVPVAPRRLIDTRTTGGPVPPGGDVVIAVPEGVPADAMALSLNVTVTESTLPGFVTVHPVGTERPFSSSLNLDRSAQTRAAGAIVAMSSDGVVVHLSGGGHLVVDLNGYVTGPSAPRTDAGLFVPAGAPTRLLDTRETGGPMAAGEVRTLPVPAGAATVLVNLTSVAGNPGFVTAWPSGSPTRPLVSSLNSEGTGDVVANLAAVPAATGMQFYSQSGTNLVVDLAGWFIAGSGPRPVVALTFDDGPGPYTAALLQVLARYGVPATFFMIGQEVDRYPSTAAAVAAAGHRIGNHTYHHMDLTALPPDTVRYELSTTSGSVRTATGRTPTCMRPPQGRSNAAVESVAAQLGLTIEQGTYDGGDWRAGVTVDEIVAALDASVAQVGGPVVVMTLHDAGGDRSATVAAIDRWLAARAGTIEFRVLAACA